MATVHAAPAATATAARRVFKKASTSTALTVYVGRRDFYCTATEGAVIEGMAAVDTGKIKAGPAGGFRVFATLTCTFGFGNDGMECLGMATKRVVHRAVQEVYACARSGPGGGGARPCSGAAGTEPVDGAGPAALTALQERLRAKLGDGAHPLFPFSINLPADWPATVCMAASKPSSSRTARRPSVLYELAVFITKAGGGNREAKPTKHNQVRMHIRKLLCAPAKSGPLRVPRQVAQAPRVKVGTSTEANHATATKSPLMSSKSVELAVTTDKHVYHFGDAIAATVCVKNATGKTLKSLQLRLRQLAVIGLPRASADSANKAVISQADVKHMLPIKPGCEACETCAFPALGGEGAEAAGTAIECLALDGWQKDNGTRLAASTVVRDGTDECIAIKYVIRAKLQVPMAGDLICEVPIGIAYCKEQVLAPPSSEADSGNGTGGAVQLRGKKPGSGEGQLIFEDFVNFRASKFYGSTETSADSTSEDSTDDNE